METNTNAEIHGAKAASRNLSSKLYKLDQESLKQQEKQARIHARN